MGTDSQGFTLMELLIAVALIALLAGIAYPGYIGQVKKSVSGANCRVVERASPAVGAFLYEARYFY